MSRELKYIVIHSTSTPSGIRVTKSAILDKYLLEEPSGKGWSKVGYSDLIHIDGTITNLTPFTKDGRVEEWDLSVNGEEINSVTRHIAYVGGVSFDNFNAEDTRTNEQLITLEAYIKYMIRRHPDVLIAGHNQFKSKTCPSFNTESYCESLSIPEKNIYRGESY